MINYSVRFHLEPHTHTPIYGLHECRDGNFFFVYLISKKKKKKSRSIESTERIDFDLFRNRIVQQQTIKCNQLKDKLNLESNSIGNRSAATIGCPARVRSV
ncbi:hypothetical protein NH340_JMT03380 [Sarcoptes scabiei]|nr:hypothetical protein NH340_JMT03380 [Sarcoptes scabiei]